MTCRQNSILSIPRDSIAYCDRFTPWELADEIMQSAEETMTWIPREEVEQSADWIQLIPCAIILDEHRQYRVFRRASQGRSDLKSRISLIVGGHIDTGTNYSSLHSLVRTTLEREVHEELRIISLSDIKPIGLVLDSTSVVASSHLGVVHEVVVKGHAKAIATEEFSASSRYNGRLYSANGLSKWLNEFDPWSSIVYGDYICPSYALDLGHQGVLVS